MPHDTLPVFREWSMAAVSLLKGAVYSDDERAWKLIRESQLELASYFARLGVLLIVNEAEGLAYLRQMTDDEQPEGYDTLPKLFRRSRLGYNETLLCVLLREELRRFEDERLAETRCVIDKAALADRWRQLLPTKFDEVKARRELDTAFGRLEELGFVSKLADEPETWEVRRILKARLPVAELESLKTQLLAAHGRRTKPGNADE